MRVTSAISIALLLALGGCETLGLNDAADYVGSVPDKVGNLFESDDDGQTATVPPAQPISVPPPAPVTPPPTMADKMDTSERGGAMMAKPGMAAPEMAKPEMAKPGMTVPEMAKPGMTAPEMAKPEMAKSEMVPAVQTVSRDGLPLNPKMEVPCRLKGEVKLVTAGFCYQMEGVALQ